MLNIYLTLHEIKNQTLKPTISSFLNSKKNVVYFLISLHHLKD